MNGKKKKIRLADFEAAFKTLDLDKKQQGNMFRKMGKVKSHWMGLIDISFLNEQLKADYKTLVKDRFLRLSPT